MFVTRNGRRTVSAMCYRTSRGCSRWPAPPIASSRRIRCVTLPVLAHPRGKSAQWVRRLVHPRAARDATRSGAGVALSQMTRVMASSLSTDPHLASTGLGSRGCRRDDVIARTSSRSSWAGSAHRAKEHGSTDAGAVSWEGPASRSRARPPADWTVRLIYETLACDHHHPGLSPRARRIPDGHAG